MSTELVTRANNSPSMMLESAVSIDMMQRQVTLIHQLMKEVMVEGEHYGAIPGCGDKPTLKKPGAEKILFVFQLSPRFDRTQIDLPNGHREFVVKCELIHRPSGLVVSEGGGSCSTMESKYRYRNAERTCPSCGQAALLKSKPPRDGFFCWAKKGGCGENFTADDPRIVDQVVGKIEYPDPADYYNTVLKMADKRAVVAATLFGTAASDIFTQDVEDFPEEIRNHPIPPRKETKAPLYAVPPVSADVAQSPAPDDVPAFIPDGENPWLHRIEGIEVDGKKFSLAGRQLFEVQQQLLEKALKPINENKITATDRAMINAALRAPWLKEPAALAQLDAEDAAAAVAAENPLAAAPVL